MVMDLLTIHQLITLILQPIHQLITLTPQPTRTSVSRFIAGHICVLAGGGEDGVASAEGDDRTPVVAGGSDKILGRRCPHRAND